MVRYFRPVPANSPISHCQSSKLQLTAGSPSSLNKSEFPDRSLSNFVPQADAQMESSPGGLPFDDRPYFALGGLSQRVSKSF